MNGSLDDLFYLILYLNWSILNCEWWFNEVAILWSWMFLFWHLQERYETLLVKYEGNHVKDCEGSGPSDEAGSKKSTFLDKNLSAALDSFDNLFCRRCLVLNSCTFSDHNFFLWVRKTCFWLLSSKF